MTRAEQIREMDDCELANFICDTSTSCTMCKYCSPKGCAVMEYLHEEVRKGDESE